MNHDAECGCPGRSRRQLLKQGLGFGLGLALTSHRLDAQATIRPRAGDLLVRDGDAAHTPLRPDDVLVDSEPILAWAMDAGDGTVRSGSRLNGLMLLRFDPAQLAPETLARAADGVVAYTQVCTHEGCSATDWIGDRRMVQCGCHFSTFDPRDGARVVEGPAPRALPALPLAVTDGVLTVARVFTDRVGSEVA